MATPLEYASLVGKKIRLVPMGEEHAERAFELLHGEDEILQWLVWQGPGNSEELREIYRSWVLVTEEGVDYRFAILEAAGGAFVGAIDLRHVGHPLSGDLGYWIGRPYQGRGYMSEAVALTTWFAFRHLETQTLSAWAFVGNAPSRRVLERNGFQLVRTARDRCYGELVVDEWSFALTRSAWERSPGTPPAEEDIRR